MKKENVYINKKSYVLYVQYQQEQKLRVAFNEMTQRFWEFDFEKYYQSGFWDSNCLLYSLFDDGVIVSHITVSLFKTEMKTIIQLGTVMTDENYRKRGLSRFLMERICHDFQNKNEGMFLFANTSVVAFYPKFGFVPVVEFEAFKPTENIEIMRTNTRRKLDLNNSKDLNIFENLVENAFPNTAFAIKNKGLIFFYCYAYTEMGYKNAVYFIEELNCAVVVEIKGDILYIADIFSPQSVRIDAIAEAFKDIPFKEIVLGFTPAPEENDFQFRPYKMDDLQLFVTPELQAVFEENQRIVPILSHT